MRIVVRILLVLVVIELIACGAYLALRPGKATAIVPDVELFDPLIMPELQELAERAEQTGGTAWREFAEGLLGKGFYAYAEVAFREAVRVDASDLEARFGLAFCLDRTGRLPESSVVYREVIDLPAKSEQHKLLKHHALYALGRNALRREDLRQAEEYFNSDLNFPPAAYQLAKLLIRENRVEEALPLISYMLKEIPYSLEFHFLAHRAQLALNQSGKADAAAAMIERSAHLVSLNFNTEYVDRFNKRLGMNKITQQVTAAESKQNWLEMQALCQQIQELAGANLPFEQYHIHSDLPTVAVQLKQADVALPLVEQQLQAGQLNATLLELAGDALQQQGKSAEAAARWERALTLTPSLSLYQKLADYYNKTDDSDRARQYQARARWWEGVNAYRSNQPEVALAWFVQASRLDPQLASAWFYQGEMHYFLENKASASAAYRKCLQLDPGYGRAEDGLRRLFLLK